MFRMILSTVAIVMLFVTQPYTAMAQSETHINDSTAPPSGSNRGESSMTVDCQSIDEWPEEGQRYAIDHDLCPSDDGGVSTQDVVYGNCGSSSFYLSMHVTVVTCTFTWVFRQPASVSQWPR